jgi:hypothetical protein
MSSMRRGGDGWLRHALNPECKQNRKVCAGGLHKDVGFIKQNVEARVGIEIMPALKTKEIFWN